MPAELALPGDAGRDGKLIFYGGGKLAADLTLPALRRRWADPSAATQPGPAAAAERDAIWHQAAAAAGQANQHIWSLAGSDPAAAQDAAWAAADTLHAAASVLHSRVIREAARAYDRAARAPYRRLPARTRPGTGLRQAARLISAAGFTSRDPALARIALIPRLAALADSVAALRDIQGRTAQAAAARAAAGHLRTAAATRPPRNPGRARTAASLAGTAFPIAPHQLAATSPAPRVPAHHREAPAAARAPRRRRRGG